MTGHRFRRDLLQANAGLAAAQAKLDEIASGTRPEQLAIDQTAVTNAMASLSADLLSAYSSADDAVHNQTDNLFQSPINNNPIFLIPQADSQLQTNIQAQRVVIGVTLANWYGASIAPTFHCNVACGDRYGRAQQIGSYLDMIALALAECDTEFHLPAATLAGYKTDLVTARTEVSAAITALTGAESALQSAQDALTLAQAGATPQDIAAQRPPSRRPRPWWQALRSRLITRVSLRPLAGPCRT